MKTIAWDVDDVLNDLMRVWFESVWSFEHAGGNCLCYGDLNENPPHNILGLTKDEYLKSLDAFRLSEAATKLKPNQEILQWLDQNGHGCRHLALTAVPLCAAHFSAAWVFKHFGKWIRTFHIVPSPRMNENIPQYDRSKDDFLKWIDKIDILVDDNPDSIKGADSVGIKGVLYPRPWNQSKLSLNETLDLLTFSIRERFCENGCTHKQV